MVHKTLQEFLCVPFDQTSYNNGERFQHPEQMSFYLSVSSFLLGILVGVLKPQQIVNRTQRKQLGLMLHHMCVQMSVVFGLKY